MALIPRKSSVIRSTFDFSNQFLFPRRFEKSGFYCIHFTEFYCSYVLQYPCALLLTLLFKSAGRTGTDTIAKRTVHVNELCQYLMTFVRICTSLTQISETKSAIP